MELNNTCRKHDDAKKEIEIAFFPIYITIFLFAVTLNSILLYVVIKKDKFVHEKRSFHKLFQILISLDLSISILILPNILIKRFSNDQDTFVLLDCYLGIRDFAISAQMITLVLIAIDRLLAFLIPLSNFWRLGTVLKVLKTCIAILAVFYIVRFILLTVPLHCDVKTAIDKYAKLIIGISGVIFMLINLTLYVILFGLLFQRQIIRPRSNCNSNMNLKINYQNGKDKNLDVEMDKTSSETSKLGKKKSSKKPSIKINRRTGSIKFVKVLFGVNLLMLVSYVPALLYNVNLILFPSYSIYYLFFLHALGDPIMFIITRGEIKRSLIAIFKCR